MGSTESIIIERSPRLSGVTLTVYIRCNTDMPWTRWILKLHFVVIKFCVIIYTGCVNLYIELSSGPRIYQPIFENQM